MGSKFVQFKGRLERMRRVKAVLTFGGGANEVLRDLVAMGLGLPVSTNYWLGDVDTYCRLLPSCDSFSNWIHS